MKTMERRLTAAFSVAFAVLVGACSSDDGNSERPGIHSGSATNAGEAGEPSTGTGGSSGGASGKGGAGGSSGATAATGGTSASPGTGGYGSVANETGGTSGSGASGGTGSIGSGSTGSGSTGGSSGGSGGSVGGSLGVGGSAGGAGGTTGGSGGDTGATGGMGATGGDSGNGGTGGSTGGAGGSSGGSGGDSGTGGGGGTTGGTDATGGSGNTGSTGGTGGDSGNGGTGGAGGTTGGTGGSSGGSGGSGGSVGGSAGTGGSSGSSGTGGSAGSGGPPPMTPFACTSPAKEVSVNGRIWDLRTFGEDDVHIAVGDRGFSPAYYHWDGGSLLSIELPTTLDYPLWSVTGVWSASSSDDVWVTGGTAFWNAEFQAWGRPRAAIWRCNGTSCVKTGPTFTNNENYVWSVSGWDADNVFALVNVNHGMLGNSEDTRVIRLVNGAWTYMTVPSHSLSRRLERIEAAGVNDVLAVGADLVSDQFGNTNPVRGILLHFDGTGWTEATGLPSDIVALWGVSKADGLMMVTGQAIQANVKKGVICTSFDLQTWDCEYSSVSAVDYAVLTPRIGAALVTGSIEDPDGTQQPGYGRLAVVSEKIRGSEEQGPQGPRVVRGVPDTDQVLVGSEDGVWSTTCQ